MSRKFINLDDGESIFFARQLESVKAKTYDVVYPELKARALLPVSSEAGPGAETIKYEQFDQVGVARIVSSYADDLPRADIKGKEFISNVRSLGAAYGYNLQEVRAAKMAGKPLQQRRANAAKRAVRQKENSIAFFGDSTNNIPGFFSNPNITSVTLPADGTGASKLWSTKTPAQILRDMNLVANTPISTTLGTHTPDTMLLPVAQYSLVSSSPRSDYSDMTILEYFLENNPFITEVTWLNELKGAFSSLDAVFVYKKDPEYVTLEIPQDFEQLPVQERNLEFVVPCHSRIGGVLMYYPLAAAYGSGI